VEPWWQRLWDGLRWNVECRLWAWHKEQAEKLEKRLSGRKT
jgi:hypothetical protein